MTSSPTATLTCWCYLLFDLEAEIGFLELAGLQRELTALLGRSVDLVAKRGLKPIIRDEVLTSARLLDAAG